MAGSLTSLGDLARHRGDLETAEATLREAVDMATDLAGEADKTALRATQILADVHYAQGRYAEAETLYVKTLETQKRVLGEEHVGTLATMNNLAILYRDQGRYAEAEPLYEQMLEIYQRMLGEEHRDTLDVLHHFAQILHAAGKTEEAEPLAREAVDLYARAGLSDSESRHADWVLATILLARGKLDEARPLMAVTLERQRRTADEADADASALNEYAWALLTIEPADLRDPAAALPIAQKAVEKSRGEDPAILDTLALAQHLTGDTPAAMETEKKALSLLPPNAPGRGDYEAALARFEAALKEADRTEETGGR